MIILPGSLTLKPVISFLIFYHDILTAFPVRYDCAAASASLSPIKKQCCSLTLSM